jgi:integrase
MALRWDDLDFERNQILVRSSLSRYGLGAPKTPGSVRTIDMQPPVCDALLAQRPRARLRSEFVFPNEDGGPLDETNIRDRNWRRLLRRAGLRYRPLYHCRHTYAVLELSDGENPLFLAKQLGHTTPETTLRRYARFMRRVPRTGTLANRFTAELRQKATAAAGFPSGRVAGKDVDFTGRIAGAGAEDRTRDVQLGKLAFCR